jgi:hypothetical protein
VTPDVQRRRNGVVPHRILWRHSDRADRGMTGRTVDFAIARVDVDDPMQTSTWCSLFDVPPAGKFRRQIEAG